MEQAPLANLTDPQLIALCLQGRDGAFDILYNRYRLQLYSYLHRLLPHARDQVDDLFQQTWIKATRNFARYSDQQRFLAWLCRIAHNLVMDYFRASDNRPTEEIPETIAADLPDPAQEIRRQQLETALQGAIRQLSPDQQEVIRLRNDGIPFKEIAARLGISLNTALGRMHYAVLNLRRMLADYL